MALKYYKNKDTDEVKASLKPLESPWEVLLVAPNSKFLEKKGGQGKSRLKDQNKILKERAHNYARDVEGDDMIHRKRVNGLKPKFNKNGKKKRKIDEI